MAESMALVTRPPELFEVAVVGADEFEDDGDEDFEFREKEKFDVDQAVEEFIDEPPIRDNALPESDSDEDDDGERQNMRRGSGNVFKGQVFSSAQAFKQTVLDHALKNCVNIRQVRYDKTKLAYKCLGSGCSWRVYCSTRHGSEKWIVRVVEDRHSCYPNGECELVKVPVIAMLFVDKIRDEPDYFLPMKIEELIYANWRIKVSRCQCQAARNRALQWIEKAYDEQFQRLRDYEAEILHSNPYSSVAVDTFRNVEGLDIFDRFYVCLEPLRRSWKDTCRPFIGVDACFIRAKMKGQLLVAVGKDGNNAIYPVAWAFVQKENMDNWMWFLHKIKADLILEDGDGYVIMSDRQKGLLRAVELVLPKIEHRMCVRHIYANLKGRHKNKPRMKPLVWSLAWSYTECEYAENLKRLEDYDKSIYLDVMEQLPETWCRVFQQTGSQCEDVENNATESFNNSIVKARQRPMIPMLEIIARQAMVRIANRSMSAASHNGRCTPYVEDVLARSHELATNCKVYRSTNNMYQVVVNGCSHLVNMDTRSCSCRKWDVSGIPCEHSYGVILSRSLIVEDYVSHWFHTSTWRNTYAIGITPMRGAMYWPSTAASSIHKPPVPTQTGRKKKTKKDKRMKGKNESPKKKTQTTKKRVMHCGICGAANHNCRWHGDKATKKRNKTAPEGESSQGVLTQVDATN